MRIGEAKVPGPNITIGALNPTGLAGKGAMCSSLKHGVYAVSESHLTTVGHTRFATELRGAKSIFKFCPGAPAPPKSKSIMYTRKPRKNDLAWLPEAMRWHCIEFLVSMLENVC